MSVAWVSRIVGEVGFVLQPFQIASAVLGIIATRLIRKLCTQCKESHEITDKELEVLDLSKKDIEGKKIYKEGKGCELCHNHAYKDRMGIHELLVLDDNMKEMVMKTQDGSALRRFAVKRGMRTLRESAVEKVLQGLTSVEEAVQKSQTEEIE